MIGLPGLFNVMLCLMLWHTAVRLGRQANQ
jgi:hypothetical protein